MPVRKIPKSYRTVTGVIASSKAVGEAQFESTLERDFYALLDFMPEVIRFEVQPVMIEWRDEVGKPRRYTPDTLVEFDPALNRKPWLCEVKYRADIAKDWEVLHRKFRSGIRHARAQGWRFRLMTEVEIRTQLLKNVRFLAQFRSKGDPGDKAAELLGRLTRMVRTTPKELLETISTDVWIQAEWLPVLWRLIASHQVGTDLTAELTPDSPIWSVP
ncbi:MAG: TnsA endonuclease N-terminal domain-containing protein [Chromatiales bacterium]|nr:TnsA endonuclease N-terminal domain-containing protein [Chromatiales bacterium]